MLTDPVKPLRPGGGLLRPEVDPACRTEFGLPPGHAGPYPRDIGNFRTAQAERISHAGLLLLGGIGPPGCGQCSQCDRKYRAGEPIYANRKSIHVSPKSPPRANCE